MLNAKNNAETILSASINSSVTSLTVADASVLPVVPFVITIDNEIMTVTNVVGNVLTVTRGAESTTPAGHLAGVPVENRWTAGMHKEIVDDFTSHLAESANKHITESGSNANGRYIKFDDGTMECWYSATVNDQALTDLLAAPIYTGSRIWTYPASFVGEYPTVVAGTYRYGSGGGWGSCWSVGLTNATMRCYDFASRAAGTDTLIGFYAIGRWK